MEGVRIERVSRRKDSVEDYYRLYAILKSTLSVYLMGISKLETVKSQTLKSYAVFLGDNVVGGDVLQDEGDVAYLAFIGLTDMVRNKGLGKLMVEHMKEQAIEIGRDRIRAETEHTNVPLFKRLGFKEYYPCDKGSVAMHLDI